MSHPYSGEYHEDMEESMKHTPGPWKWSEDYSFGGRDYKNLYSSMKSTNPILGAIQNGYITPANAHLIAASPDLLEALEKIADDPECPNYIYDFVAPAIAKAKGES